MGRAEGGGRLPLKLLSRKLVGTLAIVAALPLLALGGSGYYAARGDRLCGSCHEIRPHVELWQASTHRSVGCAGCHGGFLTTQLGFHVANLRRLVLHLRGEIPERARVTDRQVDALVERCHDCHRQEYAEWESGPHGVRYESIFLDPPLDDRRLLIDDDCLRCHGAHYEGGIQDLVTPPDEDGSWSFRQPRMGGRRALPCMTCHQIHREGLPLAMLPADGDVEGGEREKHRPSLAFYDRRSGIPVPVDRLPLPHMKDGGRSVRLSPDPRQRLCYQCHAPFADFAVGSGDDRTAVGVHEGISCQTCHSGHRQGTRASCADCHPRHSNCGLDVETMDTTFKAPDSPHDIHFVKCGDCHASGVPPRPERAAG